MMQRCFSTVTRPSLSLAGIANPNSYKTAIVLLNPLFVKSPRGFIDEIRLKFPEVQNIVGALQTFDDNTAFSLSLLNGDAFYSKPGRRIKSVSLGKWAALDAIKNLDGLNQNDKFTSVSQGPSFSEHIAPSEWQMESQQPAAFITLSDNEPLELYQYLYSKFPSSRKIGLVCTRTPFLNGLKYTLFMNDKIYESGAVGVSISSPINLKICQMYNGFISNSEPFLINSSRGNIIKSFQTEGHGHASKTLLDRIWKQPSLSSTKLYARINYPGCDGEIFEIIGGDVSKGTLALDATIDIEPGMYCEV